MQHSTDSKQPRTTSRRMLICTPPKKDGAEPDKQRNTPWPNPQQGTVQYTKDAAIPRPSPLTGQLLAIRALSKLGSPISRVTLPPPLCRTPPVSQYPISASSLGYLKIGSWSAAELLLRRDQWRFMGGTRPPLLTRTSPRGPGVRLVSSRRSRAQATQHPPHGRGPHDFRAAARWPSISSAVGMLALPRHHQLTYLARGRPRAPKTPKNGVD